MYCKQNNIQLNKNKLKLRNTEVQFMGNILTSEGRQIEKEKQKQ